MHMFDYFSNDKKKAYYMLDYFSGKLTKEKGLNKHSVPFSFIDF